MDRSHTQTVLLSMFVLLAVIFSNSVSEAGGRVGVNYGLKADNLPPPEKVVSLCRARNITILRLFDPDTAALRALHGSGIEVVLGTLNDDLPALAASSAAASRWVAANVLPHAGAVRFRYITAGNEVVPDDARNTPYVLPAMRNLAAALRAANLSDVPVTTVVSSAVLGSSYPPSQGSFSKDASPYMAPIAAYLAASKTPLLVNVYPYFAYTSDSSDIKIQYAQFGADGVVVVRDGPYAYTNLLDAMVDAVYAALERVGAGGVEVVVSETGWPSAEGFAATTENARVYNENAVRHAKSGRGTPRKPGRAMEIYVFAIFNENQKPPGTERHFGLYNPDMTEVYHIDI